MARYRNIVTGAVRTASTWPGPAFTIIPPAQQPEPVPAAEPEAAPRPRRRRKVDEEAAHGAG